MEKNEFPKICIKNLTYYYFDDIIKLEDFGLDNFLIDEKSHETILIYEISYKTLEKSHETILIYEISNKPLISSKSLRNRFDKKDRFIKVYDGSKYLVLLGPEK